MSKKCKECKECGRPARYLETDGDAWCKKHTSEVYSAFMWCSTCHKTIEHIRDLYILHYEERYCLDCFVKEQGIKTL